MGIDCLSNCVVAGMSLPLLILQLFSQHLNFLLEFLSVFRPGLQLRDVSLLSSSWFLLVL
jgi:hypothetical protein